MQFLFEPGFFSSGPVHTAVVIGAVAAIVSAVVGTFTVIRGQSFAGHALADVATTGGSAALYFGIGPLVGFIGGAVFGGGAMDVIGVRRVRGRDLATGVVLGAATGLAALFLYLNTTQSATTGATQQILFGSIFTIDPSTVPVAAAASVATLVLIAVIYRPLLLSSVSTELASARGIGLHTVGLLFMLALAISVALSSITIGSILSTALLIGPPAAALRLTRTVRSAMVVSCVLGIATTWLGILLAYDSYYWVPSNKGLPVSFFIVAITFVVYLLSGLPAVRHRGGRRSTESVQLTGGSGQSGHPGSVEEAA